MGKAGKGGGALLPTSLAENWFDRLTKFYLIPEGPFLVVWDKVTIFLALVNCFLISYMIAFNHFTAPAWVAAYIVDAVFLIDIYIKFHVAYLQNGLWVVFPKEMAVNYLYSTQFCFDVIANLPYDLIAFGWIKDSNINSALYVLGLTRTVKMIRVVWVLVYFRKQEQKLHAGFACMWFSLACPHGTPESCLSPSWVSGSTDPSVVSVPALVSNGEWTCSEWSIYVQSLYWTVTTMTTTGYGDITAKNDGERVFALFTMIIGVLFYAYVSGTIASSLSNMDSRRVAYLQKVDAIRQYMDDRDMDLDMQERVLEYYDYMWVRNKGIDVKNLFEDMPSTFKSEVALSLNTAMIEKAAIFTGTSIGFKRKIAISMKLYLFTANDYVIHKGDLGAEMFFITQGRIDIFWTNDLQLPTASLIEGAHFGEFQTILGHKHEYSARAVCNTDIYVLSRDDLEVAFNAFPDDKKLVLSATNARYQIALNSRKSRESGVFSTPNEINEEFGASPLALEFLGNRGSIVGSSQAKINGKRRLSNGFQLKSNEIEASQSHRGSITHHESRKGSKISLNVTSDPKNPEISILMETSQIGYDLGIATAEVDQLASHISEAEEST